ncbi:hypothetical protein Cgig2_020951 [Carnegiea gigantea]|uniref:Succinate dehydrogenase assembly factor 4, mitochondrial n=1 Tax=Carnegiea gigantea TaxID=171969 RepID=A0A9Q1JMI2_9CARY|nr:hypothetical protein Cgig2_020951 [Carnegiea gigantea]
MATNLSVRFTSFIATSRQTRASSISAFESAPWSQSNSLTRFFGSLTNQRQPQRDQSQSKLEVEATVTPQKERQNEGNDEEDDDDDGVYVNEETGEIGGPRGPEPTRYGDWEKGGREYSGIFDNSWNVCLFDDDDGICCGRELLKINLKSKPSESHWGKLFGIQSITRSISKVLQQGDPSSMVSTRAWMAPGMAAVFSRALSDEEITFSSNAVAFSTKSEDFCEA